MMPRIPTSVPLWTLLVAVLVMPSALESAQIFSNSKSQARSGGSAQTQTQTTAAKTPPQGQQAQPPQQTPSAERFMSRGRDAWWKEERYQKELKLTPRQINEIDWIFADRVKRMTPYLVQRDKETEELNKMARERLVDDSTFAIQVSRVENLRSKLNETRTVMLYQMMRKLTPQQYQKLQEMSDRDGRGRGGSPSPRSW